MAAIGSTWASGSWVSIGGWAAGTWADAAAYPATLDDLTTVFAAYVENLHDANPGQPDSNPLVRDDVATMLLNTNVVLDRNTQYAQYLTS